MKKNKYEKEAERILGEYAREETGKWASEMDKYISLDEAAEENFAMFGKRKYIKPQKKILRYAAILLAVVFIGSIVVPIPQASAWRVWWLDLVFGENDVDIDITPANNNEFKEYYLSEIPEPYELAEVISDTDSEYSALYLDPNEHYVIFMQTKKNESSVHMDNENRENHTDIIGDFEVLVSDGENDTLFEITTEKTLISIQTNAGYELGKNFILELKKIGG
ncbi:MAG: hypothetical protein PUA89_02445 [Frisingicoccus sp.]|uniref:hypothetical protein n=1 Tax=Frisingicoccus sp. TaxID=1918627 RepID=UPI0026249661|nr:hypothetical protein [Frisingicoccus sp.]MDD6231566.1 hypothetical protein [Frisingicoccus sp.]